MKYNIRCYNGNFSNTVVLGYLSYSAPQHLTASMERGRPTHPCPNITAQDRPRTELAAQAEDLFWYVFKLPQYKPQLALTRRRPWPILGFSSSSSSSCRQSRQDVGSGPKPGLLGSYRRAHYRDSWAFLGSVSVYWLWLNGHMGESA